MKRTCILYLAFSAAAILPAAAQTTWVGSTGVNSGTCGARTSPCATFQQAYNNASAGGIVKAIDAGEYGTVTITHSITLDGSGVATITATTNQIGVNVESAAADQVNVLGLSIHLTGLGQGIQFFSVTQGHVGNVTITGTGLYGLGTFTLDTTAVGSVTMEHLTVIGIKYGVSIGGYNASIRDSVISGSTIGLYSVDISNGQYLTSLMVERCQLTFNVTGLNATTTGATARVSDSTFVGNGTAIVQNFGGSVISYRNNTFSANTNDGTPALSTSVK